MNREHSPVIGLAILKVNSDHGKDHIDSFVPFVADVLRRSDTDVVSVPDLQEGIERGFGLRIPRGALRSMLHRCKQEGLISFRDRIFYRVPEKLASVDLGPRRSAAVETYGLILKELSGFASDRYGKEWDLQVAEAALLDYLNEKSVEALSGIVGDRVVPLPSQDVPDAIFIVNSFAAAAFVERRAVFDCLKVVVKGRMLADVLYYPALEAIDRRFRNTEVFLDTGLILRMLKLAHEDLSIPALELQELLVQQGARLACFEHTYQEIHEVLQRCSDQLRQGSKRADCGETLQFFVDEGYRPSDVELLIEKLPTLFVAAGIRVVRPPRISSGLFLDEPKLEAALQAAVGYRSRRVLLRDLDSIVGVYRAARGVLKCHLENRKALFVTTNVRVASASARYFADDFRGSVTPFCLPAYVLTTLIWLKVPTRSPDLEERQILADAYAAMNPSGALWEKYIEEVERLRERGKVSEEDYYLMRFSSAAKRELVEMTHGSA
ncbi:MAG: hypothetical protein KAY24_13660, partial [Candidatus Eisenbacteria sp.]|nr:hypothetical protein [Candidatus Eisenbacteria bacterium]